MPDNKKLQMPVYGHDGNAYIREMYEWHVALSGQPGSEGTFHSERAKCYLEMMEGRSDTLDSTYY